MTLFKHTIVPEKVKNFFEKSILSDRLAHAYLFYGNEGAGKEAFAFELAKALNCENESERPCNTCPPCIKISKHQHPDIKFIFPTSKQITAEKQKSIIQEKAANPFCAPDVSGHLNIAIDIIRQLKNEAKYAPYEAKKRFFIISGAEYLSREAANSFLKLLEEPPHDLYIIMITNDFHTLLSTIRSRCQSVFFPQLNDGQIMQIIEKYNPVQEDIKPLIRISQNNIKKTLNLLKENSAENRRLIYEFLRAVAGNNLLKVSEIINLIAQKRDRAYAANFLNLLVLWIRDSWHYLITGSSADFINIDYDEQITKFADFFGNSDFSKIINTIEEAQFAISRNAHPALTLTNLAVFLQDQFIKKMNPAVEAV